VPFGNIHSTRVEIPVMNHVSIVRILDLGSISLLAVAAQPHLYRLSSGQHHCPLHVRGAMKPLSRQFCATLAANSTESWVGPDYKGSRGLGAGKNLQRKLHHIPSCFFGASFKLFKALCLFSGFPVPEPSKDVGDVFKCIGDVFCIEFAYGNG